MSDEGQFTTQFMPPAAAKQSGAPSKYVSRHSKQPEKKSKAGKVVAIVFGVFFGLVALLYLAGVLVFSQFYTLPNTTVYDQDISFKTKQAITPVVEDGASQYSISISGADVNITLDAEDIGYAIDESKTLKAIFSAESPWLWPLNIAKKKDVTSCVVIIYDQDKTTEAIESYVEEHNETATASTDAYVGADKETGKISIVPEEYGTTIVAENLVADVLAAIDNSSSSYTIQTSDLVAPTVFSDDEDLQSTLEQAEALPQPVLKFTLGGTEVATIDGNTYVDWLTISDGKASYSEKKISAWVKKIAKKCTTMGTKRTYTRPDGKKVTISGGAFGWVVEESTLQGVVDDALEKGEDQTIEIPSWGTADVYNGQGKADWTDYIDIDITEQKVRYIKDGKVVWSADCVTGLTNGERDTPQGVYYVTGKTTQARLLGPSKTKTVNGKKVTTYEWDCVVNYWIAFVGSAVGMHDASWRSSYGGDIYTYDGSHGCVNIAYDNIKKLYPMVEEGLCVITHE